MSIPSKGTVGDEKIIITQRERELLEIVALMITYSAPEVEGRFPENLILRSIYKTIEKFTSLREDISES